MRHDGIDMGGKGALVFAALIFAALSLLAYAVPTHIALPADTGICLPPPQMWGLPPPVSLLLNILLTIASAIWLLDINRRYNFIPSPSLLCGSALLLMAGANPVLSAGLSSSTFLLLANVAALDLLFGQYGRRDIQPSVIFVVGTLFSLGSMFHYSFLFFIIAYAGTAALLKTFRLRECAALLLGILCPYWIVIGTGMVSLSAIRMPVPGTIWQAAVPAPEMLWLILSAAVTAVWGLIVALKNAISLFSASTATRAFNHALSLPAAACALLPVIDWENFMVYYMPLCLFTAIEAAYLPAFGKRSQGAPIYWLLAAAYILLAAMSTPWNNL